MTTEEASVKQQTKLDNRLLLLLHAGCQPISPSDWTISESDWDVIVRQSVNHKVAALLYQQLRSMPHQARVPSCVMSRLREQYLANGFRNMRVYRDLNPILSALREAGVAVIVLKGAYLAESVYGNVALRPMLDVDLLIRPRDLAVAKQVILNMNYSYTCDSKQHEIYHYHFVHSKERAALRVVELHWDLKRPGSHFAIDLKELWSRAEKVEIAGVETLVLCPEDQILHLCLHVSSHHLFGFSALRGLYDIAVLIEKNRTRINWTEVLQRAHSWKADICANVTLFLTWQMLGAEIPEPVLETVKPKTDNGRRLLSWAEERVCFGNDKPAENLMDLPFVPKQFRDIRESCGLRRRLRSFLSMLCNFARIG